MRGQSLYDYCMEHEDKKYLLDEWDYEKNESELGLSPKDVSRGNASIKVNWLCNKGHSYIASINNRNNGDNCPYCSNRRVLKGYNDLQTTHPEILKWWDYEKNEKELGVTPDSITYGSSSKKYGWLCDKGHSYDMTVLDKTSRSLGCPYCSNQKVLKGFNDFASKYPELLKDWDYEQNNIKGIFPDSIVFGYTKKVNWLCHICGTHWSARVVDRTLFNNGCPECSKKKRGVSHSKTSASNGNDFASNYPELLKDWDYERNTIYPNELACYSSQEVNWKCFICGHRWHSPLSSRTFNNSGCPQCAKESHSSFPEQAIYYYLKSVYKEVISGSKNLLGNNCELDIYIPEIETAIEYDGLKWHKDIDRDLKKNKRCREKGIKLIRIREEGLSDIDGSINIFRKNNSSDTALEIVIKELFSLLKIEVDINIERDRQQIYSQYVQSKKENSIAFKFPEIAKEWHPTKNGNLSPENVSCASNKKVWWLCDKKHEYPARVSSRTYMNSGCPYCAGRKVLVGFNDFATIYPNMAKEWHPTKNGDLTPDKVTKCSGKEVWWLCDKGHEYKKKISDRVSCVDGCPYCSGHKVLKGFNDLCTTHPELAKEWNYEKNGDLTPDRVTKGSTKKVWWLCKDCSHEWPAEIGNRTKETRPTGCPECGRMLRAKKTSVCASLYGNDLETNYLDLLVDWDYDKNDVLPSEISKGSHKEIHWKCSVCGYEYVRVAREQVKIKGIHCPECAKKNRNK